MFQGIDPNGLVALSAELERRSSEIRHGISSALAIIQRSHPPSPTHQIRTARTSLDVWSADSAKTLRWRADAIQVGQQEGLNLLATLRATFAASTPFPLDTLEDSFQQWIADAEQSRLRADDAIASISRWLKQSLTDWDVSNRDLHNIEECLKELSRSELNLVIAGLTPRQLSRWVEEMGNRYNGFSQAEKQEIFMFLAENVSGNSLGKIHDAVLAGAGAEAAVDFGAAIQLASADRVIAEFIRYAVRHDLSGQRFSTLAPLLAIEGIEDQNKLDSSLWAVIQSDDALLAVVADSSTTTEHQYSQLPIDALITGLATSGDTNLKAHGFLAIHQLTTSGATDLANLLTSRHSRHRRKAASTYRDQNEAEHTLISQTRADLLRWSTTVLASDPDNIVTLLASDLDPTGDATTDYFYQLISAGESEQLSQVIDGLRGGPTVDLARFADYGSNPDYIFPHAQNLGFVAGALNRGVNMCADDAENNIDTIEKIAGVAMFAVELPLEAGAKAAEWATGLFGEGVSINLSDVADTTKGEIELYTYNLTRAVELALRPSTPVTDDTEVKLKAIQLWEERYRAARDRYYHQTDH